MRRANLVFSVASSLVFLAVAGGQAEAQSQFTWDATPASSGPQDGGGTWSTSVSGTNWWDGTTNVAWPNTSSSIAVFGANGTAGAVTVSGSVTAGGITFAPIASWGSTRYTISSGTIGLGSSATILVTGSSGAWADGATIASNLVASNLTISSTGPFTSNSAVGFRLIGTNLLTGTLSLTGGMYFAPAAAALGSAEVNVGSGVTFDPGYSGAGSVTIANDLIIAGGGANGRGAIRIINDGSVAGDVYNGTVTLSADATIWGNSGHNATFTKGFGQTAGVAKSLTINQTNVAGAVFLLGKSTYTGTTFLGGRLVLDAGADSLSSQTVLSISGSGSTLVLGGTANGAISQTVSGLTSSEAFAALIGGNASTSTLFASIASGNNTFAGILGGTATNANNLALTKSGAGTLTLTGTQNTYAGNTTISGGTLALGANATMVNSPVVRVGDAGSSGAVLGLTAKSGTFTFGANQTVAGIGTINFGTGKTVSSQGIWAPGNSIGSNAVTGNLSLSGTSQFELGTPGTSASSPGTADFTSVSGTLTLGGNLALFDNSGSNSQGSYGAGSYRLFTAPTVSGTFANVTAPAGATATRVGMSYIQGTGSGQGVFANVYNLASATSAQTVNVGSTRVGSAATAAVSLTNSAPSNATFTETLSSGGFSATTSGFTANGSASGVAGGASGSGNLLVGLGSGLSAGVQTGTTTLALLSNAVNSSGLAQQSITAQTITITGTVWNAAVGSITSSTSVNLGLIHAGGSFGSSALTIANTAATGGFSEGLNASVSGSTGNATFGGAAITNLTAGGTESTITVGLGDTTTGGVKNGTITIGYQSNGSTTSGLSTISVGSQIVSLTGSVFSGTGTWNVTGGGSWGTGASGNWASTGGVAAAPGTFAGYTTTDAAIFAGGQSGTSTILLDGATPSLAALAFSSTTGRYVLDQGSGGSLTLATASGKPTVDVVAGGLHEIKTAILGSAGLRKLGAGGLRLSGSSNFTGGTDVVAGTLAVNGFLGGAVDVASGATLAGSGQVGGLVTVAAGGILAPGNSPGTLTMDSGLSLSDAAILSFELSGTNFTAGGGINDLIAVTGDLTLDGILDVAAIGGGDFTAVGNGSAWTLFTYTGLLTNNGISFNTMPSLGDGRSYSIDTSTNGVVNLVIVPEPGAILVAMVGIAGAAGWSIRRRRRRAEPST